MNAKEAAALLGIQPATLLTQIRNGKIHAIMTTVGYDVTTSEVERYRQESLGRIGRPRNRPSREARSRPETLTCGHRLTPENRRVGVASRRCAACHKTWADLRARDAVEFRCGHARDLWNTIRSGDSVRCRTCREEQLKRIVPKQPDPLAAFECGHPRSPENCLRAGSYLQCRVCYRKPRRSYKKGLTYSCGHPRTPENTTRAGHQLRCKTCKNADTVKRRRHRHQGDLIPLLDLHIRDGGRCYLCGIAVLCDVPNSDRRRATIDHVVPVSRGGAHTWDNVRLACLPCNARKGNRLAA